MTRSDDPVKNTIRPLSPRDGLKPARVRAIFKSAIWILLLGASSAFAAPLLIEAYQQGEITIPASTPTTLTVTELIFSVDTACIVQFTANSRCVSCKGWLKIDDDSLPPLVEVHGAYGTLPIVYSYIVQPGEHTVEYKILGGYIALSTCRYGYLQALIFLPDIGSAVAEAPLQPDPEALPSVLCSRNNVGNYVIARGASALVDASGRVIEDAITDGRIHIANLAPGTYFARAGERTVTKVVVVR